ncbi:hypothetical protein ACFOY4_22375 [Actinomadura syzygii]|uniref:Uncharacterized protein n=1 Tax=Actinomadura syzygii TaxID=1427538 RepID=A0A5D0TVK2_9ACTN|nr:hypothetical protein [Actinomadura syzygii]TYC09753.1 hypothetical protein FXF65_31985 [Actinomadura syzygii]
MEHRRPVDTAPNTAGDTHVAGSATAPKPPVIEAPTAPSPPPPPAEPGPPPTPAPTPASASGPAKTPGPAEKRGSAEKRAQLLDPAEAERFRQRWHDVQAAFVDDPGEAVRRADDLASDAVDALGRAIAAHRQTLTEGRDDQGKSDTERLRLALHGYRDLLNQVIEA